METGEMQEMYRRIHHALETHPYLSGMMTDELQGHLSLIATSRRFSLPEKLIPHSVEIVEFIPSEQNAVFDTWHRMNRIEQ